MKRLKKISLLFIAAMCSPWLAKSNIPDTSLIIITAELRPLEDTLSTVVIYTPEKERYDDGLFLKSFTGYQILNTENKLLLRVAPSSVKPVQLKIKEGHYLVVPDCCEDSIYSFTVKSGMSYKFKIPE